MGRAKVIYMEEYLKERNVRQRELLAKIEGHLAEAGLLDKNLSISVKRQIEESLVSDECWQPWSVAGMDEKERES
ncbi:MAG: hypothetical protein HZC44_11625 [Geobacter sp.]|nr:hypothetical protein [Geobacter sp.]